MYTTESQGVGLEIELIRIRLPASMALDVVLGHARELEGGGSAATEGVLRVTLRRAVRLRLSISDEDVAPER